MNTINSENLLNLNVKLVDFAYDTYIDSPLGKAGVLLASNNGDAATMLNVESVKVSVIGVKLVLEWGMGGISYISELPLT